MPWQSISIHAPREGSDSRPKKHNLSQCKFLSTLPARGATDLDAVAEDFRHDFYPRSPRGERLLQARQGPPARIYFYPRSPRGERPSSSVALSMPTLFLSTLPARGATSPVSASSVPRVFLSTLPARGATLGLGRVTRSRSSFLSTLPARGATGQAVASHRDGGYFYPRSPRGERQLGYLPGETLEQISIHAPREGSDNIAAIDTDQTVDFYPRSPRGERPLVESDSVPLPKQFLSTLPARGATGFGGSL